MTIFALLFNTLNVYFHNLQSIMEEVLVQLGFQEGWDLQMTRESLEKKHYHDCNLISLFALGETRFATLSLPNG